MPTLSRWFIKIGMVYFVVGLMLGAVMLAQPTMDWSPRIQALRPVYLHFLFIGWVTQIIMGVGYWMFPKYTKEQPRGSERVGWAVLFLLNLGLILRAIGEPAPVLLPQADLGWTLAVASLCLLLAGGDLFSIHGDGSRSVNRAQIKCLAGACRSGSHGDWFSVRCVDFVSQRHSD